jgi:predicted regulator of Ras-like GTPase activity (Roadblock/LC7/MglB family)
MSTAAVATARPALGRDIRALLGELMKLDHITGGLVVAPDGLVIAADLPREVEAEPLSALAATLGRELELRGPKLRRGTFPMAQFASVSGTAFLGSTPVGFIMLLGEPRADWDAIRAGLRAAVGAVYRAWAR